MTDESKNIADEEVPSSSDQDSKNNSTLIAAAAVGAAALVMSPSANAGIGDILNSLVSKFTDKFGGVLGDLMGGFSDVLNLGQKEGASKIITANAKGMQEIINSLQQIEDEKIKRASESPPDYCTSDALGVASLKADRSSCDMLNEISHQSINSYTNKHALGLGKTQLADATDRFSDNNNHIGLSYLVNSKKLATEQERKDAITSVEMLTAGVADGIRLNSADATSDNRLDRLQYINQSSKAISLEIARSTFFSSISDRSADQNQKSKLELYNQEIERTYGNQEWRETVNSYADPTPLLIELNKQMSFNNRIALDQLNKLEQQNLLSASQLINLLK